MCMEVKVPVNGEGTEFQGPACLGCPWLERPECVCTVCLSV